MFTKYIIESPMFTMTQQVSNDNIVVNIVNEYTVRNIQVQIKKGNIDHTSIKGVDVAGNTFTFRPDGIIKEEVEGLHLSSKLTFELLNLL